METQHVTSELFSDSLQQNVFGGVGVRGRGGGRGGVIAFEVTSGAMEVEDILCYS